MSKISYLVIALMFVVLFGGGLALSSKAGATQTSDGPGQKKTKWEYCTVTVVNGWTVNEGKATGAVAINYARANGNELERVELTTAGHPSRSDQLESELIGKAIAKLGADGWEMVSQGTMLSTNGSDRKILYFKRQQ